MSTSQLFTLFLMEPVKYQEDTFKLLYEQRVILTNGQLLKLVPRDRSFEFLQVLKTRCDTLSDTEMEQFCEFVSHLPDGPREVILLFMFEKRGRLSTFGLVNLVRLSAWGAPNGFKEILNMIWESEKKKLQEVTRFVISIPKGVQCCRPRPVSQDKSLTELFKHFPLHYFNPTPNNNKVYHFEVNLSLIGSNHSVKFTAFLATAFSDPEIGASVSISSPSSNSVLVGYISDASPSIQLCSPFLKLGNPEYLKVELSIQRLNDILKKLPKEGAEVPVFPPPGTGMGMDASKMVVCFGEVHPFEVNKEETLGQFLLRAARRWNVNAGEYEIQDLNFQTYPEGMKFLEYDAKGGSHVVRLVKKVSSVTGFAQPYGQPALFGQPAGQPALFGQPAVPAVNKGWL